MGPRGLSGDPVEAARAIAEERGQFGRDFATEQRGLHQPELTGPERAEIQRQRAAQYYENAQVRRKQAEQYSVALRNGAELPCDAAKTLRDELRVDMESWRATFGVDRAEWQRLRNEWLADPDELTPEQWAPTPARLVCIPRRVGRTPAAVGPGTFRRLGGQHDTGGFSEPARKETSPDQLGTSSLQLW